MKFLRSVLAISPHGNTCNQPWEDKIRLPAKMHLDRKLGEGGRPIHGVDWPHLATFAPVFIWVTTRWVPILDTSVLGLGTSICSDMWASFGYVTQDAIFCDFVCVFFVFSSYSILVLLKT